MHPIEQKISLFLEDICDGKTSVPEEIIQDFGERCKQVLRESFVEKTQEDKKFTLRMSNIGHPLRQLMLEKAAGGKYRPSKQWKLKATVGHIYEAFMLALLKASKVNLEAQDEKVELNVNGSRLQGTYDVKIDGKVYDIKTASDYSYNNKFISVDVLRQDDLFGYLAQGFGYSLAANKPFGGWIVINKSTGDFKVIDIPEYEYDKLQEHYKQEIIDKISYINEDKPIPPCDGVVEEYFNRKKTGNKILNRQCEWCDHKTFCHKDLQALPDVNSKAKTRRIRFYIGKVNTNVDTDITSEA